MRAIVVAPAVPASTTSLALTAHASLFGAVLIVGCGTPSSTLFSSSGIANGSAGQTALAGSANGGSVTSNGGASAGDSDAGGSVDHGGVSNAAGSSAAGAAAAGAPAAGGMSGTAGAPPAQPSACDGKLVVPDALIADFEDGVAGWSGYLGSNPAQVDIAHPGANNTGQALRFSGGNAATSGVFHRMLCSDVSGFDGIEFWAKGQDGGSHVRFLAVIPATDPIAGGGDCDGKAGQCSDHPGMLLMFNKQWELHRVAFADLKQYGWGAKASFNSVLNAVLWINDGPVQTFDFSIDEVALYKDATNQ